MTTENSSSLPISISRLKSSLTAGEKNAKLPIGPTSPRPGPMLLRQAMAVVKLVVKSNPSRLTKNPEARSSTIYSEKIARIELANKLNKHLNIIYIK